jgi:3-methylcrotonyl-CoA carboxylase alpha subunit
LVCLQLDVERMNKLLIANRGEIACRIIRTAQAMGIATVAVYSDADVDLPHVRAADEAIAIGPAPAAQSYLDPGKLLDAAKRTGADAVHPGYGFLSENAGFAAAVADAGLTWVGPPAAAIAAMGLKDAAKRVMREAGVPVTPGYQGADQSLSRLEHAARAIGYPLLIKATAGGGGKGMRRVDSAAEFPEALVAAQREAQRAFDHSEVLIEKYVMRARHVEVQVFADSHGNVVHLFERDCSLQRRHQKVIEEAPAPGLSDRLRHTLGVAAVTAAIAIDYVNAGTVEFIVDLDACDEHGDPKFYFMEMNTRLQVEHPVTEAITGLDLVEWQLRVARGEPLPLAQEQITRTGHAMEARLYAEDPESGFLPSTGRLSRLHFPSGPGIRIDSGVTESGEVTPFYDPMIAKVIVHAVTREAAAERLVAALDATQVEGPKTNRAFLARLASQPAFVAGDVSTGFITAHHAELFAPVPTPRAAIAHAAIAATESAARRHSGPFSAFPDFRINLSAPRTIDLYEGDTRHALAVTRAGGAHRVEGAGEPMVAALRCASMADHRIAGEIDGEPTSAIVLATRERVEVRLCGRSFVFGLVPARAKASVGGSDGRMLAPMPGRVLQVAVKPGQRVTLGERLLVLEAMKMEHRIVAPADAVVRAVAVAEGDQVAEGAGLVELDLS